LILNTKKEENRSQTIVNLPYFLAKRILVPVDGSSNSLRASEVAFSLAKQLNAELFVLTVMEYPVLMINAPVCADSLPIIPQEYYDKAQKDGADIVERIAAKGRNQNVSVQGFVAGWSTSVVSSIIEKAVEERIDLIVIGTRGLGGFERLILGSVSGGVVTHAHCNVLVVR
jgi:nucleotide-binding universal stress UspA family protein